MSRVFDPTQPDSKLELTLPPQLGARSPLLLKVFREGNVQQATQGVRLRVILPEYKPYGQPILFL
ncbi:hypothetical protein D3C76_1685530 [compost metagenome]